MRMVHRALLVSLIGMGLSATAIAGPFEDGLAAHKRGDFVAAAQAFRIAADQGNAGAQYNLALLYDYGKGVANDDTQAGAWYRRAASQGHADAQFNLAVMYDMGEGVAIMMPKRSNGIVLPPHKVIPLRKIGLAGCTKMARAL